MVRGQDRCVTERGLTCSVQDSNHPSNFSVQYFRIASFMYGPRARACLWLSSQRLVRLPLSKAPITYRRKEKKNEKSTGKTATFIASHVLTCTTPREIGRHATERYLLVILSSARDPRINPLCRVASARQTGMGLNASRNGQ